MGVAFSRVWNQFEGVVIDAIAWLSASTGLGEKAVLVIALTVAVSAVIVLTTLASGRRQLARLLQAWQQKLHEVELERDGTERKLRQNVQDLQIERATAEKAWHQRVSDLEREQSEKNDQLAQALGKLELPHVQVAQNRRDALERMKQVWRDRDSLERPCQELLFENPWVLLPDYQTEPDKDFFMEMTISKLVTKLFPLSNLTDEEARRIDTEYARERADLGGWVHAHGSLQPNFTRLDEKVLLLIELKRPSSRIGRDDIRQVYNYAWEIIRKAEVKLWGKPVECLVIGGSVDEELSDVNVRLGDSPHQAIRITPLSYDRLIARAERIVHQCSPSPNGNMNEQSLAIAAIAAE